jgi:hypothetical protein
MTPLLYVAAALSLAAIVVTIHALLFAQDGFEDETGFHTIRAEDAPTSSAASEDSTDGETPPFVSVH